MIRFAGKRGDLTWGKFVYPVTRSQKETLEGLTYMMRGLPRAHPSNGDIPAGYSCSQRADDGAVVMGLHGCSISVHRNGRITSNERMTLIGSSRG